MRDELSESCKHTKHLDVCGKSGRSSCTEAVASQCMVQCTNARIPHIRTPIPILLILGL